MAQMLPMVQIVPEMNFAYDPVTGLLSSSLGSGCMHSTTKIHER